MGRLVRGQRKGRTDGIFAGSRHEATTARHHRLPAAGKLRIDDGIRFHHGVAWGMVGGSCATAVAPGPMGTGFVRRRARQTMTVTVLGGALSLLTASCSGDDTKNADEEPRPTTPESTTSTTLTPEEAAKQEVITAREAADEAQIDALGPTTANPDLPALAETHTGLMLDRMTQTANGLRMSGITSRLPQNSQHRVEIESVEFDEVDGAQVALLDVCIVEDAERVQASTGKVLQTGVVTFKSTEAMKMVEGKWKLAERRQDSVDEGVAGCAID